MALVSTYAYRESHTYADCLDRRIQIIVDGVVTGLPKSSAKRVAHYRNVSTHLRELSRRAKIVGDYSTRRRFLLLARADAAVARRIYAGDL